MADKGLFSEKEILPQDVFSRADGAEVIIEKREDLDSDDALTHKITPYLGQERRRKLNHQLKILHDRVATELNDNSKDVMFALEKLRIAQRVVIEDEGQYEEALYWVTQVKNMLIKKHAFRRWSYTWGLFVFFYALLWLVILLSAFFMNPTELGNMWYAALAGGVGGVVFVLNELYQQISIKQEFDRQYVMMYILQPILGIFLGVVMFFMLSAGFLAISATDFGGTRLISLQILLSFVAGFGQQPIYNLINSIGKNIFLKSHESKTALNPPIEVEEETIETPEVA